MNDYLREVCCEGVMETVNDLLSNGLTESEIYERIKTNLEDALLSVVKQAANDTVKYFNDHMYEVTLTERARDAVFLSSLEMDWGKCFAASQTMYTTTVEIAEYYWNYVHEDVDKEEFKSKQYLFLSLQHLHGRACQEFLEILTLMRNGFADGAYARWRSMFEICCIADFLFKHGEDTAKKYYEQSETEEKRYIWASEALGKKKPTFSDIQDDCNIDIRWKRQYKVACFVNHASPQGTFKRLANGPSENAIPVGRSNYGLTTPAEHSAISLEMITATFLKVFPYMDGYYRMLYLHHWVNVVRELYFDTHELLFNESIYDRSKENGE